MLVPLLVALLVACLLLVACVLLVAGSALLIACLLLRSQGTLLVACVLLLIVDIALTGGRYPLLVTHALLRLLLLLGVSSVVCNVLTAVSGTLLLLRGSRLLLEALSGVLLQAWLGPVGWGVLALLLGGCALVWGCSRGLRCCRLHKALLLCVIPWLTCSRVHVACAGLCRALHGRLCRWHGSRGALALGWALQGRHLLLLWLLEARALYWRSLARARHRLLLWLACISVGWWWLLLWCRGHAFQRRQGVPGGWVGLCWCVPSWAALVTLESLGNLQEEWTYVGRECFHAVSTNCNIP